ncbi:glycosyltransferase family 4 protein [Leptolyngbya sp. AN02str]|uniref:glycosyltransferase family 4 protein n=1 Tax=Leptolyngbya sp. AN02str TaxID=3423363 RepID=UPI003D3182BE
MLDYQPIDHSHPPSDQPNVATGLGQPYHLAQPKVALFHCMDLIDDFLDHIGWSLEKFCDEFTANWMYGFTQALQQVGVETVIFCISARVDTVSRFIHKPTGSTICVIPASKPYRLYQSFKRRSLKAYGGGESHSFKEITDTNPLRRRVLTSIKNVVQSVGSYLATPSEVLAQELQREGCQAVLCQEYEFPRFDTCTLVGKRSGIRVFATFQGGDKIHSWLEYPLRHLAFRACTGLIIGPQTEINRVKHNYHVPDAKIARIFNPLDVGEWVPPSRVQARDALGIPHEAKVVVYHGRMDLHRKGLDVLMAAWEMLCRDRPQVDLRLLLLGSGPDAEKLQQIIETRQLKGILWRNQFVSDRAIIQQHLAAADVYTLPSRQEGFPIAPIEAMAVGLPVVAADAPGVPDILEQGEHSGGLVVPREDVNALAEALGNVLDNDEWRHELGQRAHQRIEQAFAPYAVGLQLRQFLLGEPAKSSSQLQSH